MHYEETKLQSLVEDSQLVVVARVLDPIRTLVEVPIAPKGAAADQEKYPPFNAAVLHFSVVETLYADRKVELPAKLDVVSETLDQRYSLHVRYYVEGVSKSPIYRRYEPKAGAVALEPGTLLVLFLRWPRPKDDGGARSPLERALAKSTTPFSLVVDGAIERMSMKKEIQELVAKHRAKGEH